jgi:hypothetical protein
LFEKSQYIFFKYGLKNSVISVTDLSKLDLGHSIPIININSIHNRTLSNEINEKIKNTRKFICDHSDWNLDEEEQFTIEPQLISINNKKLPKVSFHYLVKKTKDNNIIIMNENDELLREYGLLS